VLAAGGKRQDLSTAETNINSAPDLPNKSKVDQLKETEERRRVEEATSSPQASRDGETGIRPVIPEGETKERGGIIILKRNLSVIVVDKNGSGARFKAADGKKKKKGHELSQEILMIKKEGNRRKDMRESPSFGKTTIRKQTKTL
jgi:hypothetical protein